MTRPPVSLNLIGRCAWPVALVLVGCTDGKHETPVADPPREESPLIEFEAPERPPTPTQGFVGSQACRECHADVCDEFHTHPMGRSLARTTDPPVEDYVSHPRFDTPPAVRSTNKQSYEIEESEDGVLHHEILTSAEGEVIYDLAVPVHYAVGSGQRGRSYLINRDGLLFMSPVTWYANAGRWDLSPGYQTNNQHFSRRIVDGCLGCHAGNVAAMADAPDRYAGDPFLEESIGCEKCHGPGRDHIAFHRDGGAEDSIVNPANLPPERQSHVCFQCHLTGEHRLTRYGRTDFDFRPGDTVADIWTVFVKGTGIDAGGATEAVSQVEQMLSSVCYQRSDQVLGCVSCHDPHKRPDEADQIAFYRQSCLKCHGPDSTECSLPRETRLETSPEDSCIACHMPKVDANDVPHTSQTDHRILRQPRAPRPAAEEPADLQIFGESEGGIPVEELKRALAISLVRSAEQSGNAVLVAEAIPLLQRWVDVVPDDLVALRSLGLAYWLIDDFRMAVKTWESGLALAPDHEYFLRRMFVLYHDTQQYELAADFGRRLIQQNPWDFEYLGRQSHVLGLLGQYEESAKVGERALLLNPLAIQIHRWLGQIYDALEDPEKRDHHLRQAELKSR